MCVVAVKKYNNNIGKEDEFNLELMEISNPHGCGLAISCKREVVVEKNLEVKDVIKIMKKHSDRTIVAHFRLATTGSVKPQNCHPFELGRLKDDRISFTSERGVGFHNGVFPQFDREGKKYDCTDSAVFFNKFARELEEAFNNLNLRLLIEGYVSPSRIVVLRPNNEILQFGIFHKLENLWVSNLHFTHFLKEDYLWWDEEEKPSKPKKNSWDYWEDECGRSSQDYKEAPNSNPEEDFEDFDNEDEEDESESFWGKDWNDIIKRAKRSKREEELKEKEKKEKEEDPYANK